jgi:hypothetical protein
MKTVYLITLFLGFSMFCLSQNHPIGHRTITYLDVARGNRPIPSELYYPATSAGESTPLVTGKFPVIVFGHGFQMAYDSYAYFKNAIVTLPTPILYVLLENSDARALRSPGSNNMRQPLILQNFFWIII